MHKRAKAVVAPWVAQPRGGVTLTIFGVSLPLSAIHRSLSFFPSTVHFIMSRYPEVCLYFIPCISIPSFRVSSQTRTGTDTTTTDSTRPIQRRIHMTNRTTHKILSHILEMINHVLFQRDTGYPPHGRERIPIELSTLGHDPYAAPYGQSPSPNHHETHAMTSYPHPPHVVSLPPPPPAPFQQQHVAFTPGPSYSTSDLNLPPPPSLSNTTSTPAFQPYVG